MWFGSFSILAQSQIEWNKCMYLKCGLCTFYGDWSDRRTWRDDLSNCLLCTYLLHDYFLEFEDFFLICLCFVRKDYSCLGSVPIVFNLKYVNQVAFYITDLHVDLNIKSDTSFFLLWNCTFSVLQIILSFSCAPLLWIGTDVSHWKSDVTFGLRVACLYFLVRSSKSTIHTLNNC